MDNIDIEWDNPERTMIRIDYKPEWTWEDYHSGISQISRMVASINHPYVTLNHYAPGTRLPKGTPHPHMQRAAKEIRPAALKLIVTRDRMIRSLIEMSLHGDEARGKTHFCDTLDEAREFARQHLAQT